MYTVCCIYAERRRRMGWDLGGKAMEFTPLRLVALSCLLSSIDGALHAFGFQYLCANLLYFTLKIRFACCSPFHPSSTASILSLASISSHRSSLLPFTSTPLLASPSYNDNFTRETVGRWVLYDACGRFHILVHALVCSYSIHLVLLQHLSLLTS